MLPRDGGAPDRTEIIELEAQEERPLELVAMGSPLLAKIRERIERPRSTQMVAEGSDGPPAPKVVRRPQGPTRGRDAGVSSALMCAGHPHLFRRAPSPAVPAEIQPG